MIHVSQIPEYPSKKNQNFEYPHSPPQLARPPLLSKKSVIIFLVVCFFSFFRNRKLPRWYNHVTGIVPFPVDVKIITQHHTTHHHLLLTSIYIVTH